MSDDDSPTLGEKMNRALYLDPGFTEDKPGLVDALRDDIDATTKRAQANVDQQRRNAADVELIAKDLERERAREAGDDAGGAETKLPDEP